VASLSPSHPALEWSFVTAGGPGGQHVNKVATAVMLRVHVAKLEVPERVTLKLLAKAGKDGTLVIVARRFKSQLQNRNDALARLEALIAKARLVPKVRRATTPTRASGERRLGAKKVRADVKKTRGKVFS
jgi:ribosome-associated protein